MSRPKKEPVGFWVVLYIICLLGFWVVGAWLVIKTLERFH